jgi:hypothetical protein
MGSITKLRPGKYPKKKKWGWEIDDIIIAPSGAEYECIDSEPYYLERFDKYCTLLIWQGNCDTCNDYYTFKSSKSKFMPRANCPDCRSIYTPGELIGARKRRLKGGA